MSKKTWTYDLATRKVQQSRGRLTFSMSPDHMHLYVKRTSKRSRKNTFIEVSGAEMAKLLAAAEARASSVLIDDAKAETEGAAPAAPEAPVAEASPAPLAPTPGDQLSTTPIQ